MIRKIFKRTMMVQVLSQLAATLGLVIDGIIIGRFLGVDAIAAYGLVAPVMSIVPAIGGVIVTGAQVLCSREMGRGEIRECNRLFSLASILTIGFSVLTMAIIFLLSGQICNLLGATASNGMLPLSKSYLLGYTIGTPGFIGMQFLMPFMQLDADRQRTLVSAVVMSISDVVFDLMNVLMFKGGLFGMGLASAMSYYVALIILLLHFVKKDCQLKLELKNIAWNQTGSMIVQGSATAEHKVLRTMLSATLNWVVLAVGGAVAVAALTVINSLNLIFNSVGQGMGASTMMITGIMYGEGNRKGLREVQTAFFRLSMQIGVAMLVMALLGAPVLVRLFMKDGGEAETMAIQGIRMMGLYYIVYSISMSYKNYFQGIQNTIMTHVVNILQSYVYLALGAVLLSRIIGMTGIWLSFVLGESLTVLTIFVVGMVRNKQKLPMREMMLFLPASYGIPDSDRFDCSIQSMEQVLDASVQAGEFCAGHAASGRIKYLVALCVEEMAGNVIRHGFSDGAKHSLDVSVCWSDGTWILRFRDDCAAFSPMDYYEIHHPDDPTANIGIRLVFGIAKDVKYLNTMRLNNVIITL